MLDRTERGLRFAVVCGIVSMLVSCGASTDVLQRPGAEGDGNNASGDGDGQNTGDGDGQNGADGQGSGDGDGQSSGDGQGGGDGDGSVDFDCEAPIDTSIRFPMAVDNYFFVSGYSGDGEQGKVRESTCSNRAGDARGYCHTFDYEPGSNGWASVFWQYPPDNWGAAPGRIIPKGARELSFWAWGDAGGEKVQFGAGIKDQDAFSATTETLTLTTTPTRYTVRLSDQPTYCEDVVGGFFWSAATTRPIKFHVDDIVWDGEVDDGGDDNLPPLDPNWPSGPGAQGVSLRVRNFCPFPLYIGGAAQEGELTPRRTRLARGEYAAYDVPKTWTSARVNAFDAETDFEPRDKAELTFFYNGGDGTYHVSYNVTYVDWLGLPMEITAVGGACNFNDHTTGCHTPVESVLDGCPQSFLRSADRCMSPRSYCPGVHQSEPYCQIFNDAIASCRERGCPQATTAEVYACSGPYANEPRWCAAINRGMVNDPDNQNQGAYYQNPPYNDYSKWVHDVCPGIYAFSYDDQFSHGGYRDCSGGTEVRITLCPGG